MKKKLKMILFSLIMLLAPCISTAEDNQPEVSVDKQMNEQDWRSSIIRDPSLSAKCRRMIEERNDKIRSKQKIQSLILRNTELQKEIPTKKENIAKQLKENHERLLREKELNLLKIRVLTENIIKKGCPSIEF